MTVKECYQTIEADYEGVISRLLSDERVKKYLLKFLDDGEFHTLCSSLEQRNYQDAFRAVHNLKGLSQNLGISRLQHSSAVLADALRNGEPEQDTEPLLEAVRADYEQTVQVVEKLQAE